jgi:hypothetical protein
MWQVADEYLREFLSAAARESLSADLPDAIMALRSGMYPCVLGVNALSWIVS